MRAVGNAAKAMSRAEHSQGIVLLDEISDLFDGLETMQVVRTVAVVAGPVGEIAAAYGPIGFRAANRSPADPPRVMADSSRSVFLFMLDQSIFAAIVFVAFLGTFRIPKRSGAIAGFVSSQATQNSISRRPLRDLLIHVCP